MVKKMSERNEHKSENSKVEEGNAISAVLLNVSTGNVNDFSKSSNQDDGKNGGKEDNNDKKDRITKRKSKFDTDEKESVKKHKKSKDIVGEAKEVSMETCLGGKEDMVQESREAIYLENNFGWEAKRISKSNHEKNRDEIDALATMTETLEHGKKQEPVEVQKICGTEDINKMVCRKENECKKRQKKKKQKLEKVSGNDHFAARNIITNGNDTDKENSVGNEVECRKLRDDVGDSEDGDRGWKKKSKPVKNDSESKPHKDNGRIRKIVNTTKQYENLTPKDRSRKVSLCDNVEVFPCADAVDDANKYDKEGLVYGRRFSKEEDEIVMKAVADYIESHNLGDDGINMILNRRAYPEVKNCWKEIQAAIPWRPFDSVYQRGRVLLERDEKRGWTLEEYEIIRKFVQKHGRKWKLLADSLGKNSRHVRDTWRRIKLSNRHRGHWSQEEYQNLFDFVNLDLCMRAHEEKKSKHGMLRDNICWNAIGDKMQTRASHVCCSKWYRSLTSPMVAEGIWANTDDYRMLDALYSLDACCMEDVDWDNLIQHRPGDMC